jgi:pyruvate dehydrogenase E1 component
MIACYVEAPYTALGTDGFGRSDTRSALRRFFEVDRHSVVLAALHSLAKAKKVSHELAADAVVRYGIDSNSIPPWTR